MASTSSSTFFLTSVDQLRRLYYAIQKKVENWNRYHDPKDQAHVPPTPLPAIMIPLNYNIYVLELRIAIFLMICITSSVIDVRDEVIRFLK